MIAFADVLGFVLTLVVLFFLFAGGYVASVLTLDRGDAERQPATVFIETIVGATALALGIGLVLGASRHLEITYALGLLAFVVITLVAIARRRSVDLAPPVTAIAARIASLVRDHPALSILAANAIFLEAAFALLHPPLSWDSIETHALLAGHWFHSHDLSPFLGAPRLHVLGATPAAGSVYLWWWLASAHSELYLNLAYLPHWLLLGAVSGSIARSLGAERFAPFAAVTPLMLPLVLRWVTTQYPDLLLTSMLLAAVHFALRYEATGRLREMRWAGVALGVAMGVKAGGIVYVAVVLGTVFVWLPRPPRERLRAIGTAIGVALALGSYFYVRNALLTGAPFFPSTLRSLAMQSVCDPATMIGPRDPAIAGGETWRRLFELVQSGRLLSVFLGSPVSSELESGVGPAFAAVVVGLCVLPRSTDPSRRWMGRALLAVALGVITIWLVVPPARGALAFRNLRYLEPAAALGCISLFAWLERRGLSLAWGTAIAVLVAAQGLLSQTVLLAAGPRTALFVIDAVVLLAAVSPRTRALLRRRAGWCVAIALSSFAAATPWFAEFRDLDRARAYGEDVSGHDTLAFRHARAWAWLDSNGADGTVAFVASPLSFFYYPAMGMRLERRVVYVGIDAREGRSVTDFPGCHMRDRPDREAWFRRLDREGVRWLLVSRYPPAPFPIEAEWARSLETRFALRYGDATNLLFERVP